MSGLATGRQLVAAEEERAKWEEVVSEVRKDIDLTLQSLRAAEKLGEDVLLQVKECNAKVRIFPQQKSITYLTSCSRCALLTQYNFWNIQVQELEKELIKCILEDRRIENVKTDLKRQTERLQRLASDKVMIDPLKSYEFEMLFLKKLILSHNAEGARNASSSWWSPTTCQT